MKTIIKTQIDSNVYEYKQEDLKKLIKDLEIDFRLNHFIDDQPINRLYSDPFDYTEEDIKDRVWESVLKYWTPTLIGNNIQLQQIELEDQLHPTLLALDNFHISYNEHQHKINTIEYDTKENAVVINLFPTPRQYYINLPEELRDYFFKEEYPDLRSELNRYLPNKKMNTFKKRFYDEIMFKFYK